MTQAQRYERIAEKAEQYRLEGKRIVFTNGCFDILHAGHISYLNSARALGDVLILGLNSDDSVRRLKGAERPINNEEDRAHIISALRAVDDVVVFTEDTPLALIQAIQPDILAKGGDYTINTIVGADLVQARGGRVEILPFVEGKSTTSLVKKIQALG